jgi:hypothetical protein
MEKEFVPYQQALELKELGFDEPCFGYFDPLLGDYAIMNSDCINPKPILFNHNSSSIVVSAPLYQQAFSWFREKYGLYHSIGLDNSLENDVNCDYQIINHSQSISELETDFKSYEEAELECLKKLIEIIKNK